MRYFFIVLLLCFSAAAIAQTTLAALTANNTAACPASGKLPAHCHKPFQGQVDSRPDVATPEFDAPAGNVSAEDLHTYFTGGAATRIYANIMLGFCTSSSGGCHNNVQTGYTSNDARTVAAQVEDMGRRHLDGAVLTWEGAGTSEDSAALKLQGYLTAKHCRGPQQCDLMYLLMFDGPSTGYTVTSTGIPGTTGESCSGKRDADYENCVIAHIRNDMCYMNGRHWGNDAYQKAGGRPMVQIFPEEGVIPATGSAPSWADVWVHIQEWNSSLPKNCGKAPYNADNGVPLVLFENSGGFTHVGSSGAYSWLKPAGTDPARDQFNLDLGPEASDVTLDNFYHAAAKHPDLIAWGGAYKGFNSSQSAWGTNRIMDQQCGQVWMMSLRESDKYYTGRALPYLQIATWNDYNEGTEIESGIDNCYRVNARVSGEDLVWNLDPGKAAAASLSTVSHMEIYDSTNGRSLTLLASTPASLGGTYPLTGLTRGPHQLFVRMVGKNSIANRISPAAAFTRN